MAYNEEEVRLATAYGQLTKIREAATDLFSFVDLTDSMTFDKEDGTPQTGMIFNTGMSYAQALMRPSATACAYINEFQLRMIRARSRAFVIRNPYWMSVRESKISYAVGTGHVWSIVPRRKDSKVPESLRNDVEDELKRFCKVNQYRRRQGEKLTRLDRDGEYFLRFVENREDGVLRVRFIEPILIQDPPGRGPETRTWFGVQFDGIDYEEPMGYYVRPATYTGGLDPEAQAQWEQMVPAGEIQHRTANVDIGSPRGLPTTYFVQEACVQALSTLRSMGKLVDIRARIALIRKQVNATIGQIQPLLNANRAGQVANSAGQLRNVFGIPYGAVIDTNDQREYQFPSQHIETDKIVHSLKSDLQSVAAAVGLADFTISGDSTQSFANALVKEGPMDRAIGRLQRDLVDDDLEVYERALEMAITDGRLPRNTLKKVRIEILPPQAIARTRIQDTQADEILVRNGAMSADTMAMRANLDPEDERMKAKANPSPQVVADTQGTGNTRSNQAPMDGKVTARAVPSGAEPGPDANVQRE